MALDPSDKRRLLWATLATVVALPALWLMARDDDSTKPSTASAGVDVATGDDIDSPNLSPSLTLEPPLDDVPPVFLGGPTGAPGAGVAEVAVPTQGAAVIQTTASYRRSGIDVTTCLIQNMSTGGKVTIVNRANNRSIECTARLAAADQKEGVMMHADAFLQLADPTDAPITVDVRQ